MARFAAPLCFNFLHVIRMNDVAQGEQVRGGDWRAGPVVGLPVLAAGEGFVDAAALLSQVALAPAPLPPHVTTLPSTTTTLDPQMLATEHGVLPEDGRHEQRRPHPGSGGCGLGVGASLLNTAGS